jgi:hypothetical protein
MGEETINLDDIPEERMTHNLFCYLMEAACIGKEIPLGDTGYKATCGGRPIPSTCTVIVVEDTMFFAAGSILNKGGMRIKRYHLKETDK